MFSLCWGGRKNTRARPGIGVRTARQQPSRAVGCWRERQIWRTCRPFRCFTISFSQSEEIFFNFLFCCPDVSGWIGGRVSKEAMSRPMIATTIVCCWAGSSLDRSQWTIAKCRGMIRWRGGGGRVGGREVVSLSHHLEEERPQPKGSIHVP